MQWSGVVDQVHQYMTPAQKYRSIRFKYLNVLRLRQCRVGARTCCWALPQSVLLNILAQG